MSGFRFYHILFAATGLLAYLTAEELGLVHAWTGYALATLLAVRLVLGLTRRRGFQFRRLIPRAGPAPRGQGGPRHPAIGHALSLALFTCVLGAAGTGIAMDQGGTLVGKSIRADDGDEGEGTGGAEHDEDDDELSGLGLGLIPVAHADEGGEEGEEEGPLGELHETFGNAMLILAAAHAAWLLLFRFPLARYMLFVPRRA